MAVEYEPEDDEVDRALRDHHNTIDRIAAAAGVKAPRYGVPYYRAGEVARALERRKNTRAGVAAALATAAAAVGGLWLWSRKDRAVARKGVPLG